ncbi:MAG TPA: GDP-mannose 4,6-dehydratase [Candidatus Nanoarchaeia archaeon]|nr:GDP-mannose 4,6-dehydratase [Candidatus Nanoarchaeia archaeon]
MNQKTNSDYWRGKNALVTGATGILGSWLVKTLVEKKSNVVIIKRDHFPNSELELSGALKKVSIVHGSLEDYWTIERALNEYEIDTCFHLGAQALVQTANRSPLSTFEANLKGTWNVLEACRHLKLVKRIVVASSDKAYGEHEKLPYDEDSKLNGLNPYDASKSCCDIIAQSYAHSFKMPIGIARCGNIYGGGDLNFSRIIPGTIKSLLEKQAPVIRSDGTLVRDYFYVEDAVDAFLMLAKSQDDEEMHGHVFNFSPESPISVIDLVRKISKIANSNLKPKILSEAFNEIQKQYLDCSKARKLLNWQANTKLDDGLKKTFEWYQKFFDSAG